MRHPFVHELFCRNAEAFPAKIAILQGERQVSYKELNDLSSRIVKKLAAAGVVKGETVALFLQDRISMIAAILATLKAGCAFIPAPPELPDSRLGLMFEQCEPAWLLTGSDLAERAGALCTKADRKTQVVCFPSEDTIGSEEQSVPLVDRDPDDFCYVYFTSGSSGKPKGIAGRLRAIDHFIRWEIKTLELGPGTRVSQLINPSFDAFLRDIFVPLCSVGTICVPRNEILFDGEALAA
jgi:non-ribosomal peptide synthetase component F